MSQNSALTKYEGTPAPCTVILGATGGVGSALARLLTDRGHRLLLAARDEAKLVSLGDELNSAVHLVDATDAQSVTYLFEHAAKTFGRVDTAANCVGSLLLKPAHLTTEAEWQEVIAANLTSAFATTRAAAKAMLRTGGSIVLVSSAAANIGMANHEAIAAAKAGVIGLARSAAATYASRGIRVNCVAPGMVDTPLTADLTRQEATREAAEALHPLGRIGRPGDVASAIAWLLEPNNNWVTGQVLGVDGGLASLMSKRRA